jgi:hypothetical protein
VQSCALWFADPASVVFPVCLLCIVSLLSRSVTSYLGSALDGCGSASLRGKFTCRDNTFLLGAGAAA